MMFDTIRIPPWVGPAFMLAALCIPLFGCSGEEESESAPPPAEPGPDPRAALTPEDMGDLVREEIGFFLPWTETIISRDPQRAAASVTVTSVELTEENGYDRLVITLSSDAPFPGYRIAPVEPPFYACLTAEEMEALPQEEREEPIEVAGSAWLMVELTPARGHDDSSRSPAAELAAAPGLPGVETTQLTCDRDEKVRWILGVEEIALRRVLEMRDPTRLVVDIQHGEGTEAPGEATNPGSGL
jgi:hypothetical protein